MKILLHQFNEYYIVKYEILKEIIDRGDYNINIYDGKYFLPKKLFYLHLTDIYYDETTYQLIGECDFNKDFNSLYDYIKFLTKFDIIKMDGDIFTIYIYDVDYIGIDIDALELRRRKIQRLMNKNL